MAKATQDKPVRPPLRYLGTGYIVGVPARDLTADEAAAHWDKIAATEKAMRAPFYAPVRAAMTDDNAEEAGNG